MDREFFRHNLYFLYLRDKTVAEAHAELVLAFGSSAPCIRTCRNWYVRFRTDGASFADNPRCGRPAVIVSEDLLVSLSKDRSQSTRALAEELGHSQPTILRHLHRLGKSKKKACVVPHDLSDSNKDQRVSCCTSLLDRYAEDNFLERLVTSDETWLQYDNPVQKSFWVGEGEEIPVVPSCGLHPKKHLLCIWWCRYGLSTTNSLTEE